MLAEWNAAPSLYRHGDGVFRLFCIGSSMFPASSYQAGPSTHAQHPFCSFPSERSLFRGHYSAPDLVLSDVLLSGVDASNCWHETFSGPLRASQNAASQHVFCAFSQQMCQSGLDLFTRVGISLLAVCNGMRGGSFCSPD